MRSGFSLVEMLVVLGIIAVLTGAGIGGYAAMSRAAERAKCQELVSNVATAMAAMYQQEGAWPKRIAGAPNAATDGRLDETVAYALVRGTKYLSLNHSTTTKKLTGLDRFGIVTPWATAAIRRAGTAASLGTTVSKGQGGDRTVDDHLLHFAIDDDGDGIIRGANVGGQSVDVRASVIVWCAGKDGKMETYSRGLRKDDVYSWSPGQARSVQ
jgi:prepilin-type N-terminal cleavage/methylation domain-containing protein